MPGKEDSLFSLELVVEKVYIPHVTCRFPAVAFRLLDFPTIVINHVESDLAKNIKAKISRDPYYQEPAQFSELKDKHGNFMVKKGKSCLFKIPVESLKMHLVNTPMYVMVIDMFPDVPKLLGNSTVPLNSLMDEICVDIAKMGTTVPSVHGDKGLFKLYSLMGKEIGYFVLGFRLLCLGPSLIPHLPESALVRRVAAQTRQDNKVVEEAIQQSEVKSENEEAALKETREMGSMTDVERQDVMLQTIQMDDKAVHVAISEPEEPKVQANKLLTTATQTEKRKRAKQVLNEKQRFVEKVEDKVEDDGVIINNIVCPPPLFYNSEANPKIKIQRPLYYDDSVTEDDLTIDDLESDYSVKVGKKEKDHHEVVDYEYNPHFAPSYAVKQCDLKGDKVKAETRQSDAVFPILTALLNELSFFQNPQLLQSAFQKAKVQSQPAQGQTKTQAVRVNERRLEQLSRPRVQGKKFAEGKESAISSKRHTVDESLDSKERKTFRKCSHPQVTVPKNKGWIRQVPEHGQKKSVLTYGLTNTQRLRLAKTNPAWLQAMEKEEADAKARKAQAALPIKVDSDELDVTNFSDTLTEVRRLAEKELEKGHDQTLDSVHDISAMKSEVNDSLSLSRKARLRYRGGRSSPEALRSVGQHKSRTPSPKHRQRGKRRTARPRDYWSSDSDDDVKKAPISLEPGTRGIRSPDLVKHPSVSADMEDLVSARSDQPNSQKSIEVRLPSAQIDEDADSEGTLGDEDEVTSDEMKKTRVLKFPGFVTKNSTLPESINGRPNESLSESQNFDNPLESTRNSRNYQTEYGYSRTLESTEDTRQFHSTDEPELQGLMSDEDQRSDVVDSGRHGRMSDRSATKVSASLASSLKFPVINPVASEQSPIPATRRSAAKLDLGYSGNDATIASQPDTTGSQESSKRPTPRPRRPLKAARESLHTDSVSSYMPSDPENPLVSLSSEANYSDDFYPPGSEFDDSLTDISSPDIMVPKLIPSTKLGYTIN